MWRTTAILIGRTAGYLLFLPVAAVLFATAYIVGVICSILQGGFERGYK